MTDAPRLLNADVLERFEALLRAKRIGIVDAWAPGLTDAQIDEIVGPTDLQMPEEARAWWRWHNGRRDGHPPDHWEIVPSRDLIPLQIAVGDYQYIGTPGGLLIPVGEKPRIYVKCDEEGDVPAPIYCDPSDEGLEPALASFGELVLTWIDYIERDVFAVGPEGGWAHPQPDPYADLRSLGVL